MNRVKSSETTMSGCCFYLISYEAVHITVRLKVLTDV